MAPGSDLPNRIRSLIDGADWFVLLLSTSSGQSAWVADELRHWLSDSVRAPRVLVVSLGDDLSWSADQGLTAPWLDHDLGRLFAAEPLYVLLGHHAVSDPLAYRSTAVRLVAAILETAPEAVAGEERRLRGLRVRLLAAGIATLSLVTVAAVSASVFAIQAQGRSERSEVSSFTSYLGSQALVRAPDRPDIAAELAVAAWDVRGGRAEWSQMLELAARLPSGMQARQLPLDAIYGAPALSPSGATIAVIASSANIERPVVASRLAIAEIDSSAAPVVIESGEDAFFLHATWLSDDRVAVIGVNQVLAGRDEGVVRVYSIAGDLLGAASFPLPAGEMAIQAVDRSEFMIVASAAASTPTAQSPGAAELRLFTVRDDGRIAVIGSVPLPPALQGQLNGLRLHVDLEQRQFWLTGDDLAETYVGNLEDGMIEPWIGGREALGLPDRAEDLWAIGPDRLIVTSVANPDPGRLGGSAYLLERTDDRILVKELVAASAFVPSICISGGGDHRSLAAAALGERIVQVGVRPSGFLDERVESLAGAVAVACSPAGTTAWVTSDGLVVSRRGELSGEARGLTWLRPIHGLTEYLSDYRWLRKTRLALDEGGIDLVTTDDDERLSHGNDQLIGTNHLGTRAMSSCLAVHEGTSLDESTPDPLIAVVGTKRDDGSIVGECPGWEVRNEDNVRRLWYDGEPTDVEGFSMLALDEEAGVLVSGSDFSSIKIYSITGSHPVEVGEVHILASEPNEALLLYSDGLLMVKVHIIGNLSEETADFAVVPVGAEAVADYLCGNFYTGSLGEATTNPSFPGDPHRLDDQGCTHR